MRTIKFSDINYNDRVIKTTLFFILSLPVSTAIVYLFMQWVIAPIFPIVDGDLVGARVIAAVVGAFGTGINAGNFYVSHKKKHGW